MTRNWNWLATTGLVLTLTACGATGTETPSAAPDTSSSPASSAPPSTDWQRFDGVVTKVSDGDTVHITSPGLGDETVRALGTDTPETHDPRTKATSRIPTSPAPTTTRCLRG